MMTERIFIDEHNEATILCPQCGQTKIVDVSPYVDLNKAIRVKYTCKKCRLSKGVLLERRRVYRKPANFAGIYTHVINGRRAGKGHCTVRDVSRNGLGLSLSAAFRNNLSVGDKLIVEFHLNDAIHSLIKKEVRIKTIKGLDIGTEFCAKDHYDITLGFYLMN